MSGESSVHSFEKASEMSVVEATDAAAATTGMIERPRDIAASSSQQHLQQRSQRGGGHSETTTGSRLCLVLCVCKS